MPDGEKKPDYQSTWPLEFLAYVAEVGKALSEIKRPDYVEVDNIPVTWHGEVCGYLVLSEIHPGYDFAPPAS